MPQEKTLDERFDELLNAEQETYILNSTKEKIKALYNEEIIALKQAHTALVLNERLEGYKDGYRQGQFDSKADDAFINKQQ